MDTDDLQTNALQQAVTALLENDAVALQHICQTVNQPQLNLCLIPTALGSSVECLKIVIAPLKGLYDASADCLKILAQEQPNDDALKALLPFSNPATIHPASEKTLWAIALLFNMPLSFYQDLEPNSATVARAMHTLKECIDPELLQWCVKKSTEHSGRIFEWAIPSWKAAQNSKNFMFLNILASHVAYPTRWIDEIKDKWDLWEQNAALLTQYPQLAALVVGVAVEYKNWKVVHTLIGHAEKSSVVTDACVATHNIFACNWAFSHGFVLSPKNLWDRINQPEKQPLQKETLKFFMDLLACDHKWKMGAWEQLKTECGTTELFCQLLIHGEEAANLLLNEVDPQFKSSLPLRLAAMCGRTNIVNHLLPHSKPAVYDSQALALAALNGHEDVVRSLLPHSNSADDNHRALACGLWHMVESKTPNIARLLLTPDTSPEKTVQGWLDTTRDPSGLNFTSLFADDDDDTCKYFIHEITEDCDDWGELRDQRDERTTVYGNTMFRSPNKMYPMSWVNFDQPITHWWSSIERNHLIKIKHEFDSVFPQFFTEHLCASNQSVDKPQRKM